MQKISGVLDIIASIVITCTRYTCLMIVNYYYINIILKMILIIGKTCFKKMKQDVYLSRFHYFYAQQKIDLTYIHYRPVPIY